MLSACRYPSLSGGVVSGSGHSCQRGQCKYCRGTRWAWLFQRRSQCSVYFCLDFAMCQPVQSVWRRLHDEREEQ